MLRPTPILSLSLCFITIGLTNACTARRDINLKDAQYWQRAAAPEATYQRGPKAQQTLNQDIANCVTEVRELVRLGALRQSIHNQTTGYIKNPDEREMAKWDDPQRDRYMLTEHSDYNDFEGCMVAKGWERVKYVPYDTATESARNYRKSIVDYEYQSRKEAPDYRDPNFKDLND